MILDYIKFAVVNELPDVTNKIYLLQKEIINDNDEVETIYEEWIFTPECLGRLDIEINGDTEWI